MKSSQNQVRDILSILTSNKQDGLFQAFLLGTAYVRYKMDNKILSTFTLGVEQLITLSFSMGRQDIIQNLYDTILFGKEQTPIKYVEYLTDKLFQDDTQMPNGDSKLIEQINKDELYSIFLEEEEREKNERNQIDDFLAKELAQSMEDEERQKLSVLRHIENIDQQNWKCEICLEQMTDQQFWPLECRHQFHRDCLTQYFNVKIKDRAFPLKCPHQNCKSEVDYGDLKEILTKPEFQKYEEFQLNNYIDKHNDEFSWCPTAGCKYAFVLEHNQTQLICPLCSKRYCLACKCEYHKNQTCKEYQVASTFSENDQRFEAFVRGQKFKQCLNCKMWVERNQGCDHMTCRCGCQFCYKCGGPYQKCDCVRKS